MQSTKVSNLLNSPDAGSTKRLNIFRSQLSLDRTGRLFDRDVLSVLRKYALRPDDLERVVTYLAKDCVDKDGYKFSRSLKLYKSFKENYEGFTHSDYSSFRWNKNYQQALKYVGDEFNRLILSPARFTSDRDIQEAIPKKDTHSGWSWIETGIKEKGEYMDGIYANWLADVNAALECGSFNNPILPGVRTQCSGAFDDNGQFTYTCKHKARLVSMVDIYQIITELRFSKPVQQALGVYPYYAGSKSPNEISQIIHDMQAHYSYYLSIDYSGFDQSISSWLIEDAFACIKKAFKYWNDTDEKMWNLVIHDFIHKCFVSPDGTICAHRGVPSGSMFTQIIDTVVNRILILTYLFAKGLRGQMIIMGDDNLLYVNTKVEYSDLKSYLEHNFGVRISDSKVTYGSALDDPEFLSRTWKLDGQWRHPRDLIGRLLYPERRRTYNQQVTPELVVYSYLYAYNLGMAQLIDVDRFLQDNCFNPANLYSVDSRDLPGYLRYLFGYTEGPSPTGRKRIMGVGTYPAQKGSKVKEGKDTS